MKNVFFLILGIAALMLGIIGVLLPILPTTPFLLLASFCFLKGSPKLNNWFEKTKMYKKYVKPIKEGRGMTVKTKLTILIIVYAMLGILFFTINSVIMKFIIILLLAIKTIVFIRIKTLKGEQCDYD